MVDKQLLEDIEITGENIQFYSNVEDKERVVSEIVAMRNYLNELELALL